MTSLHTKTY